MKAANDGKYETPKFISEHKKLYKHAKNISQGHSLLHNDAFSAAAKAHLGYDLEKGIAPDYEKLEDVKIQQKFAKTMTDMYQKAAISYFKSSKDISKAQKDMLMKAYVGMTGSQIEDIVGRSGKDLTPELYEQNIRGVKQAITRSLYDAAGDHIKGDNAPAAIKHMGLEGLVKGAMVDEPEVRQLLQEFHDEGSVSATALRRILPSYKRITKKKKDKAA
jgi:hypothetical protein